MIWARRPTLELLHELSRGSASAAIGIEFTEIGDDFLTGRMPVDSRTKQPHGALHGGASVLLAETLGSVAALHCVDRSRFICVGQEVNANHLRPVSSGWVTGIARPFHIGRRSHVWGIDLYDDAGRRSCVSRLTIAVVEKPGA